MNAPVTLVQERRAKKRIRLRVIVVLALFFFAMLLQLVFEHPEEITENLPMPVWLRQAIQQSTHWLDSPFGLIPRPLEARYAALVSISDKSEGPSVGPCEKRELLSKLLPAIDAARPAIIVLDFAFRGEESSESCNASTKDTKDLVSAINQVARNTPLVIGQDASGLDEKQEDEVKRLRYEGFGENDLLLKKPISLDTENNNVSFGLIQLNKLIERVPIVWFVHKDETSGALPMPALGFVSAEIYRSSFPNGTRRLNVLEESRYHPVAFLLPERDFAVVNAIELLCPADPLEHNWKNCPASAEVSSDIRAKLHGRVVVVGVSDNTKDQWNTGAGRMAGYVLQANYIEALLDARVYRPVSFWPTLWLSLVWLILVELPFWILKHQVAKGLIFSLLVSIVVLFLAKYVALVNFGLYISPFAPSVLLLGVSLLHVIAGRAEKQGD